MKRRKRIAALLLAAVLLVQMIAIPAFAATRTDAKGSQYKTVFVHGMMGWGGYENVSSVIPYWGAATGSTFKDLESQGYHDLYNASVGPLSSGWDRACELYAQITGTRVDYGVAHSEKYGHDRYGRDYSGKQLIPGFTWNSTNKLNLIGHSFGATAIRVLSDMLADGRSEEVAASKAAGTEVSPLFTGGKGDYVFSITTLAGTNNGTSYRSAMRLLYDESIELYSLWAYALSALGLQEGFHDFQLDQFGVSKNNRMSITQLLTQTDFLEHNDSARADFDADRAIYMNGELEIQPNIYYFAYPANASQQKADGTYGPIDKTFAVLKPFVSSMGKYTGTTSGKFKDGFGSHETTVTSTPTVMDKTWWPNDGFVNVIAAKAPFHYENGKKVYDPHTTYTEGMNVKPGTWYEMPEYTGDHLGIIGGLWTEDGAVLHQYYRDIMRRIYSLT